MQLLKSEEQAIRGLAGAPGIERAGPAAPLSALAAIAVDLETTGLHPQKDRILQIGAIAIRDGRLDESSAYEQFVAPPTPLCEDTVSVHGISGEHLRNAPPYAAVHDELRRLLGTGLVIGYSIDFDLAMLSAEAERAGLEYVEPPHLDVMLLAMGIDPLHRQQSLDDLVEQHGVARIGRHSALGDAKMTARVYLRLIPAMRERGIRTLAQAQALQERTAEESRSGDLVGWMRARRRAFSSATSDASGLARTALDGFVYRTRLQDLANRPVVSIDGSATLQEAAGIMHKSGVSSLVVRPMNDAAIVTQTDMTRMLATRGASAAEMRVNQAQSYPLVSLPGDTLLYRAIGRMSRQGIRHLAITGPDGGISGMVSLKAILRERSFATLALSDHIENADTPTELAAAQAHLPRTAAGLLADRLDAREVAEIISLEGRAMTARAAEMAEQDMLEASRGDVPAPYCLLVLGSGGRRESLLAPDQDNALIVDDNYTGNLDDADDWFAVFSSRLNQILHEAGIPRCPGEVMARSRNWRRTESEWKRELDRWVSVPQPKNLLNVDIFYDLVAVHGESALANRVMRHATDVAAGSVAFVRALGDRAANHSAPLGLWGRLRTGDGGRIDLKAGGLLPVVSGARAMALRHGIGARSTGERLRRAISAAGASVRDAESLREVHGYLLRLILEQQIADIDNGITTGNKVLVRRLGRSERSALRDSLKHVELVGDILKTVLRGVEAPRAT